MVTIQISNIHCAGYDLFQGSESFLNELTEEREIETVVGGASVNIISISIHSSCLTLACYPPPTITISIAA